MYKGVFKIEKYTGQLTSFHRPYYVFDGLGSFNFETLTECRHYVSIKSIQLKNTYQKSKELYLQLTQYYFEKLIKFRISDSDNNIINSLLSDCLDAYKYISKPYFPQYVNSKLKYIYNCLLSISRILKNKFLESRILHTMQLYFVEYPRYMGDKNKKNNTIKLTKSNKYVKKVV